MDKPIEFRIHALPRQTRPGTISVIATAVTFINNGTNVAVLDNSVDIPPGGTLSFSVDDENIISRSIPVRFIDSGGTNQLDVMSLIADKFANYKPR